LCFKASTTQVKPPREGWANKTIFCSFVIKRTRLEIIMFANWCVRGHHYDSAFIKINLTPCEYLYLANIYIYILQ
jgi:hypothetical protein